MDLPTQTANRSMMGSRYARTAPTLVQTPPADRLGSAAGDRWSTRRHVDGVRLRSGPIRGQLWTKSSVSQSLPLVVSSTMSTPTSFDAERMFARWLGWPAGSDIM